MEDLLSSFSFKRPSLHRGELVEGEIVAIAGGEVILDIGSKSEGVLPLRDIPDEDKSSIKPGMTIKAYVVTAENESGQTILSKSPQSRIASAAARGRSDWSKFITAQERQSKLQGKVLEINKGGLIVEVSAVRGFLPNSQVGFELMNKAGQGLENLIGESLTVTVIEVDIGSNKLIFSQRGSVSAEIKAKLESFQSGQQVTGKIVTVLPFGLVVDVSGTEGLVFISDVSWDRVEDLPKMFVPGQELEVKVLGQDLELGRLNLSIKQLTEDPFVKLTEKFPADEVVKGEVVSMNEAGVVVKLAEGVEGFLALERMAPGADYKAGTKLTFLVDSVDIHRRRINLAPFVTSTEGLIYK